MKPVTATIDGGEGTVLELGFNGGILSVRVSHRDDSSSNLLFDRRQLNQLRKARERLAKLRREAKSIETDHEGSDELPSEVGRRYTELTLAIRDALEEIRNIKLAISSNATTQLALFRDPLQSLSRVLLLLLDQESDVSDLTHLVFEQLDLITAPQKEE